MAADRALKMRSEGGTHSALLLVLALLVIACLSAFPQPACAAEDLGPVDNPVGATMNVFDYWITGQEDFDSYWPNPNPKKGYVPTQEEIAKYANGGINKDHALKFHLGRSSDVGVFPDDVDMATYNDLNKQENPNQGIVGKTEASVVCVTRG